MGTKNFINPLAFTDELTTLDSGDLILVRDISKQKKDTYITSSNLTAYLELRTFVQVSTTYQVLISDYTIECTANSFTVTLPTAVGIEGKIFNIANSGSGIITLVGDGLSEVIYTDESFQIQSNGTNYIII